jgi:hypothetical protein
MKLHTLAISTLMLAMSACTAAPAPDESNGPLASLELALTGSDAEANVYRLRNATFSIDGYSQVSGQGGYGYVNTSISSEDSIDDVLLTTRLLPGSYSVGLVGSDWYLERVTPNGAVRVQEAVLLSAQSQYVWLSEGGVSQVYFQFGADGTLIDFRHGDLTIGISVERAPGAYDDDDAGVTL